MFLLHKPLQPWVVIVTEEPKVLDVPVQSITLMTEVIPHMLGNFLEYQFNSAGHKLMESYFLIHVLA